MITDGRILNVTIAMPCLYNQMNVQTVTSVIRTMASMSIPRHLSFVKNTYLHLARTYLVREAKKYHSSHIFYLDNDMAFKDDDNVIMKLLSHNKDVIGVDYNMKKLPLTTTVRMKNPDGLYTVAQVPDELCEVDAVGTGCMLVDMRVFDKIEKPWFFYNEDVDNPIGEDVWFCRQVRKAGLSVWCDPTINVKHIGDYEY